MEKIRRSALPHRFRNIPKRRCRSRSFRIQRTLKSAARALGLLCSQTWGLYFCFPLRRVFMSSSLILGLLLHAVEEWFVIRGASSNKNAFRSETGRALGHAQKGVAAIFACRRIRSDKRLRNLSGTLKCAG